MTLEAVPREPQGDMIHGLWRLEVLLVAGQASRGQGSKGSPSVVLVAALAGQLQVRTLQGEQRVLVEANALDVLEAPGGVALGAVRRQGSLVDVQVAGPAFAGCAPQLAEPEVVVAGFAGGVAVAPVQAKARHLGVIEGAVRVQGSPTLGGVAVVALYTFRKGAVGEVDPGDLGLGRAWKSQQGHRHSQAAENNCPEAPQPEGQPAEDRTNARGPGLASPPPPWQAEHSVSRGRYLTIPSPGALGSASRS